MKFSIPKLTKTKVTRRIIEIVAFIIVIVFVLTLPLLAGTKSYPITVVEGNSMDPTLQNGDLVYYTAPKEISNGTIIVFSQDNSGIPILSGLIQPIVIHRVVDISVRSDGLLYFETKGDNNNLEDPGRVKYDHVLGVATVVIPKIGLVFLFIKSPQGLIAIIGLIVIIYLSVYETKVWKDKKKAAFIGELAQKTLNKELPEELFKKFELATQNIENIDPDKLADKDSFAMVTWLKKGALDNTWKIKMVKCDKCSRNAIIFESSSKQVMLFCLTRCGKCSNNIIAFKKEKDQPQVTCPHCYNQENQHEALPSNQPVLPQKQEPGDKSSTDA